MTDTPSPDRSTIDIERQASALMKQGMGLVNNGGPESLAEALDCFDRALALRRRLPFATVPRFGYGLAACWLNRAEALMQGGGGERFRLATEAFDEAIALLRGLPLDRDPRFARRLAIAHQNRGLALQVRGESSLALAAFTDAITLLEDDCAVAISDRPRLLAAAWTNLANMRSADATTASDSLGRAAARRAIQLVTPFEDMDPDSAEIGLNARHVVCRIIARRLAETAIALDVRTQDIHDATDLADEGLHVVQRWERQGVTRFREVALDLFRFGAGVYGRYQPQFLGEFVLEHLDPDRSSHDYVDRAEMRAAAQAALALTGARTSKAAGAAIPRDPGRATPADRA